ncbi:hypothetical protein [Actinomadura madurae]|uniref:hypothetical protein n=1 Tax=Actinomadura madurae TaxID=1993 RepID=UPI003557A0FC
MAHVQLIRNISSPGQLTAIASPVSRSTETNIPTARSPPALRSSSTAPTAMSRSCTPQMATAPAGERYWSK